MRQPNTLEWGHEDYQEDRLHLTPQAYDEFAAVIKPIIAKVSGK
jgi:lysophospholipase L1-like esterase